MSRKGRTLEIDLMRTKTGWTVPFLAIWLLGCGNYTVIFRVQDVINTGGRGDNHAKLLDVDRVCLAPSDAEEHHRQARGTIGFGPPAISSSL